MLTVEDIKKAINGKEYEYYGIRVDYDIKYNVGDKCHKSHEWWQDSDVAYAYGLTDEDYNESVGMWDGGELDGTCAIGFDAADDSSIREAIELVNSYFGDCIHILGSDFAHTGNDIGELVMCDADILGTYEKN